MGDQVLKTAAESFQQGLREMDLVGRWGGEEFVMLIPAVSLDLGRTVAERARITLEALTVDATPEPLRITASFGIAFDASGTESFEDLISEADAALYEAKRRGRNRVEPTASPEG